MEPLTKQVVIVTGASRGLGREMALRFADEGAQVVLAARSETDLTAVAEEAAGETLVVPTDVTSDSGVENLVASTIDRFGGVDTLVNNAGVGLLSLDDRVERLGEITREEWDLVLDTNLTGTFLCTRAVLPHMVEADGGAVINVTSQVGRNVFLIGDAAWAPYTVSKWGVEALTRVTALEYADDGITANAVDPGGRASTDFWSEETWPDDREIETYPPDAMNDAVVLLAAQGPDGVTGESLSAADWKVRLGTGGE